MMIALKYSYFAPATVKYEADASIIFDRSWMSVPDPLYSLFTMSMANFVVSSLRFASYFAPATVNLLQRRAHPQGSLSGRQLAPHRSPPASVPIDF